MLPLIKGELLIKNYTLRALKPHNPSEQIPGLFVLFGLSPFFKPVHRLLPLTCISYRGNPAGAAAMPHGDTTSTLRSGDTASTPHSRSSRCRRAQHPSPACFTRAYVECCPAARSCFPREHPGMGLLLGTAWGWLQLRLIRFPASPKLIFLLT